MAVLSTFDGACDLLHGIPAMDVKHPGSLSHLKGSSSWLTAVKRAFRSPSKDSEKKASKQREEPEQEEEEKHKKEKRRWLFRKSSAHEQQPQQGQQARTPTPTQAAVTPEQRHAIALAVASAATAEAAVATAQAAVEVVRLTQPSSSFAKEQHYAAVVIQTAFRGYLVLLSLLLLVLFVCLPECKDGDFRLLAAVRMKARRALRALKGLVKLQALVRGHNVRKQAKMTLRCMQALVRVQARVRDQRMRLAHESSSVVSRGSNKSSFSCDTSLWDSKFLQELAERRSMAMLHTRKEAALKRERALSYAFSHQLWRSDRNPSPALDEDADREVASAVEQMPIRWMDRYIASRSSFDNRASSRAARASTDHRDPIKTLEIDTSRPFSYSAPANPRRPTPTPPPLGTQHACSPLHRAQHHHHYQTHSPVTPSPSKTRPLQVRSASPRYGREDRSFSTVQTPSYHYHHGAGASRQHPPVTVPNYMTATESAKARVRSQSAPRQRPATPERDRAGSAKKRLSFPAPDPYGYSQSLRSPSFKSAAGRFAGEPRSNVSSSCNDSLGGEVSPSSTTELRRWLR
ncbi:hypothetical protein GW17_00032865 [Ensete ventricosum]|nr:hypothetical protein GW17_00032865 [Ensete ventricosum]